MSRIDRKSRDRKQGHKSSTLPATHWGTDIIHYTPVERAFLKRNGKKAMRKQHAKAIKDGYAEMLHEDREDRLEADWDDIELSDDWYLYKEGYISLADPYFDGPFDDFDY